MKSGGRGLSAAGTPSTAQGPQTGAEEPRDGGRDPPWGQSRGHGVRAPRRPHSVVQQAVTRLVLRIMP